MGIGLLNLVYPINSIYISGDIINPGILFGGTWVEWGSGRVLVGVDTAQAEFNTVGKTGGNKFTEKHYHDGIYGTYYEGRQFVSRGDAGGGKINIVAPINVQTQDGSYSRVFTGDYGTGDSGNLQPYITCYMWKRTS